MRPATTFYDVANRITAYAKLLGEFAFACAAGAQLANLPNIIVGQLMDRMILAPAIIRSGSTLLGTILHVVHLGSKKQMRRVDAARIIAPMADVQIINDWSVVQFVAKAVRANIMPTAFRGHRECTVAMLRSASRPQPALIWAAFVYLLPKAFFYWANVLGSMPGGKAHWLTPHHVLGGAALFCNACLLSTTALAITVGNILRGMIGVHQNLQFCLPKPGAIPVAAWLLSLVFTPVIVPQAGGIG
jgi:hypothetical protein